MDANTTPQYSAPTWGKSPYADLDLPSGAKIRAKRLDMMILVETDLMDEMDSVSGSLNQNAIAPAKGKGKKPADRPAKKLTKAEQAAKEEQEAREMMKGDSFKTIVSMLNRLIPAVVVQPPVEPNMVKTEQGKWVMMNDADREEGVIYPDTIPMADQMHIMNWCMEGMDTEELASFRDQSKSGVGTVEDESELQQETE